jgi:hypothetical protein
MAHPQPHRQHVQGMLTGGSRPAGGHEVADHVTAPADFVHEF